MQCGSQYLHLRACFVALACACATAKAQVPAHYPSSYADIVSAARREGKVVVYSTTDTAAVAALIRDFESMYPGVHVEYSDLNSAELHNRYLAETREHQPSADVLASMAGGRN